METTVTTIGTVTTTGNSIQAATVTDVLAANANEAADYALTILDRHARKAMQVASVMRYEVELSSCDCADRHPGLNTYTVKFD